MDFLAKRQIRVFISSTFEDMKDEREYLIKKIFPEMRQVAYKRNVSFIEVDLRWGITEEDSKNGKVVDICFDEIDNSIPFFIGIIGNRYGWRPEKKDISRSESKYYDFIDKYINKHLSVTEMEILYGALDRKLPIYASFYINSNTIEETLIDYPQELNTLKASIRNNGRYPHFEYSSKEELGEKVKDHFIKLLDNLFPIEDNLSEVDLIKHSQMVTMSSLCSIYIEDSRRFSIVDAFVNDPTQRQLLIVGDSGVGKSAFMAEWVRKNLHNHDIVYYSVGSGENNSDKDTVLLQLSLLINNKYDLFHNDNARDLNVVLNALLDRNLIVVIDAFNQIEMGERDVYLDWFPNPKGNIKFIITTALDNHDSYFNLIHLNTRHILSKRENTQEYIFRNFSASIRRRIISGVLKEHGKNVLQIPVEKIINCKLFKNGLALRLLLNELIICSNHKTVVQTTNKYLRYKDISSFINSVLKRYEKDYGYLLVKKVLTLLAISENGLSEAELRDMVNDDLPVTSKYYDFSSKVSHLQWSQFYCAFKDNLSIRKGGLLGFSHQLIQSTILNKYVHEVDAFTVSLRHLIINMMKTEKTPRAYTELANQYLCIHDYKNLQNVLCSLDVFYYFIRNNWGKFCEYWIELCVYAKERCPLSDIVNTWQKLSDECRAETYNRVEQLLVAIIVEQQGHWPPNVCPVEFAYMQELCIPFQKTNRTAFHYAYSAGSGYMSIPEKYDIAQKLLVEAIDIIENSTPREWPDYYEDLQKCYYEIAQLYHFRGNHSGEIYYLERFISPCEKYYGEFHIKSLYANYIVGYIKYEYTNDYLGAIQNLQKALLIAENLNDANNIGRVCNGLVQCYSAIFKKEEIDKKYDFSNLNNYLKYLHYYEKLAFALKDQGDIESYNMIIREIIEMKKSLDS